jgi:hypothetical protein
MTLLHFNRHNHKSQIFVCGSQTQMRVVQMSCQQTLLGLALHGEHIPNQNAILMPQTMRLVNHL